METFTPTTHTRGQTKTAYREQQAFTSHHSPEVHYYVLETILFNRDDRPRYTQIKYAQHRPVKNIKFSCQTWYPHILAPAFRQYASNFQPSLE